MRLENLPCVVIVSIMTLWCSLVSISSFVMKLIHQISLRHGTVTQNTIWLPSRKSPQLSRGLFYQSNLFSTCSVLVLFCHLMDLRRHVGGCDGLWTIFNSNKSFSSEPILSYRWESCLVAMQIFKCCFMKQILLAYNFPLTLPSLPVAIRNSPHISGFYQDFTMRPCPLTLGPSTDQ